MVYFGLEEGVVVSFGVVKFLKWVEIFVFIWMFVRVGFDFIIFRVGVVGCV